MVLSLSECLNKHDPVIVDGLGQNRILNFAVHYKGRNRHKANIRLFGIQIQVMESNIRCVAFSSAENTRPDED